MALRILKPLQPKQGQAVIMTIGLWLSVVGIWAYPLIEPDEPKHALIVKGMLEGPFWLPRLMGEPFFDKPILPFALMAVFAKLFGLGEFAIRLPGALLGFASVMLLYGFVLKHRNEAEAFWSGFMWATTPLFLAASHIPTHDMYLTFFSMAATSSGYELLVRKDCENRGKTRFFGVVFWLSLAGGVLSKGLLGLVLPGIALLGPSIVLRGRLKEFFKDILHPWGLLVFLVATVPWYAYVFTLYPEFGPTFFVRQHLGSFIGILPRHPEAFWYYIPLIFGIFFPWAFLLPFVILRSPFDAENKAYEALWISQGFGIFLFFSLAVSKIPLYLLPALPGFCLGLAPFVAKSSPSRERNLKILLGLITIVFLAGVPYGLMFAKSLYPGFFKSALILSIFVTPILLVGLFLSWKGGLGLLKGYIVFGLVFLYSLGFLGVTPLVAEYKSGKTAVTWFQNNVPKGSELKCYRNDCLSAQFYFDSPIGRLEHLDANSLQWQPILYILVKKKHLTPFLAEAAPFGLHVVFRSEGFWLFRIGP